MLLSRFDKRVFRTKFIVAPSFINAVKLIMSSEHHLVLAEIEFWRETLRQTQNEMDNADVERMHQALILAQNKLVALDMTVPVSQLNENFSIAYH